MEIASDLDIATCEGLTRLFRFAIGLRDHEADQAALGRLEDRFGLTPYEPEFRGAIEDFARQLDGLEDNQRFTAVCSLISGAISDDEKLDAELVDVLLEVSSGKRIVRFSFAPCLLLCLRHAQENRPAIRREYHGYELRYSGIGADRELIAFTSLFLNLPIYTETNPPWDPDTLLDDDEPNVEQPELELSFPPADFRLNNAPHLEASVRASKLPRAVDRGKSDLESVMLDYLCEADGSAFVFTSENFLSSTKQSRLVARQHLLDQLRVRRVSDVTLIQPDRFLIELGPLGVEHEMISLDVLRTAQHLTKTTDGRSLFRPTFALIPVAEIRSAGASLKPSRYITTGPAGGQDLMVRMNNIAGPPKRRLVDLFDITRPKTTTHNPAGTLSIQEVRAGNISANGEITGKFSKLNVRSSSAPRLEEQVIKPGDILFAHRGPIGHVAFVTDADIQQDVIFAGQTLLILSARRRTSGAGSMEYCDPRVLFMYLLTADVRASWRRFSLSDRSPAIPIGEIENFGLPENLVLPKKPKRLASPVRAASPQSSTDLILAEFRDRQDKLIKLREFQTSMNEGLNRVWETAWEKPVTSEK